MSGPSRHGLLSNLLSWNVLTFGAFSLRRITTALFVYSVVVLRQNKSMKIDFPLTLIVYHRKISTFIKKQNTLANWASIKESIQLKTALKNVISNAVLIVEAKRVKSWVTENIANFQIKVIRRLIYCNMLDKKWKFHVRTTKLPNFIKVWKLPMWILLLL